VPVPDTSSGADFHLVPLAEGYLAQIGNVLIEYSWTGKKLWTDIEARGSVKTIVTPAKDGFFVVVEDLNMNNGFHVKRAITTHE
jgi:hypothetical protein